MSLESCWALANFSELLSSPMGEQWLVYDRGSGSTLVVDPMVAALLEALSAGRHCREELLALLAERFELPRDAALDEYLQQSLQQLYRQGLIRSIAA